jgi:ZIP zinc/iron transport family
LWLWVRDIFENCVILRSQLQTRASEKNLLPHKMKNLLLYLLLAIVSAHAHGDGESNDLFEECEMQPLEDYDFVFHIVGVLVVFAVSAIGMFSTIWLGAKAKEPIMIKTLMVLKMFGIGVIIGTAWIHLLPDAISQFTNPCLPLGWQSYGTGYIGLFACIAAFGIQVLEQVAASKARLKIDSKTPSNDTKDFDLESAVAHNGHSHDIEIFLMNQSLTTIILELGIVFHSVIIGVTLGVTPDDSFTTLLTAICFHQLFEGMALGALISSTRLKWKTKVLLGLFYPLSTPLGISIGIAVRDSFDENSSSMILIEGILGSLSLGILIYNSYVELVGGEINRNPQFISYSSPFKCFCYLTMFAGAAAMAIVGIWA